MSRMLTLEDLDLANLSGVRVLARVDFNVPIADGKVMDDTRLVEVLPTLAELSKAGARVVLVAHQGRPKGQPNPKYSLRPAADRLAELLGKPVAFGADCIGPQAEAAVAAVPPGGLCLLENLRYHAGEEANDPAFAAALAALAEAYVDDAFGAAHRAHASTVGVAALLPRRAAGRLLVREVDALSRLLGEPDRPFAALLGGAKIEGKIDTLVNLLPRLDILMVGGGMANTFLAAQGHNLQRSLVEPERIELAGEILAKAAAAGIEVLLPSDVVVTDHFETPVRIETVPAGAIPEGMLAVDVGPDTRAAFAAAIARARTLFWNGPLGVFEKPPFDAGTQAVARALAGCPGFTVLGGGETVAAAHQAGVAETVSHVSTGGGASLEFLAGRVLPGVAALERV
jgi:phosphoglycerate kinase